MHIAFGSYLVLAAVIGRAALSLAFLGLVRPGRRAALARDGRLALR